MFVGGRYQTADVVYMPKRMPFVTWVMLSIFKTIDNQRFSKYKFLFFCSPIAQGVLCKVGQASGWEDKSAFSPDRMLPGDCITKSFSPNKKACHIIWMRQAFSAIR
ncbi:MAG: hypothetical protein IT261_10885 [Saprospiraceae bacterium]|nr:hypothetical protein [Saprospiraceae bacterium]